MKTNYFPDPTEPDKDPPYKERIKSINPIGDDDPPRPGGNP